MRAARRPAAPVGEVTSSGTGSGCWTGGDCFLKQRGAGIRRPDSKTSQYDSTLAKTGVHIHIMK